MILFLGIIPLLFLGVWVFSIIEKTTTVREMITTFAIIIGLELLALQWFASTVAHP